MGCTALITDRNGKTERKTFFFYIDLQPPEEEENLATIKLKSAEWPRKNSRRVDYNQSVRNLTYEVENNTALNMRMEQKIKTLWTAEKEPIVDILRENDELGPYEARLLRVDQITMSREQYQDVLRGTITLRCHAIALETTKLWEKGHRLAEHNINFYLNMDPSYGFFEEPEDFDGGRISPARRRNHLKDLGHGVCVLTGLILPILWLGPMSCIIRTIFLRKWRGRRFASLFVQINVTQLESWLSYMARKSTRWKPKMLFRMWHTA